jgi:hypothetical protein
VVLRVVLSRSLETTWQTTSQNTTAAVGNTSSIYPKHEVARADAIKLIRSLRGLPEDHSRFIAELMPKHGITEDDLKGK